MSFGLLAAVQFLFVFFFYEKSVLPVEEELAPCPYPER